MSTTKYVILGGGMVAGYAAKELVEHGLKPGELTIVSADSAVPYERPPLSKGFLAGKDSESSILINPTDWYREHGIELKLHTTVERIDAKTKVLGTSAGEELRWEHLLIASGARPRRLELSVHPRSGVFYLRSMSDSEAIRSAPAKAAVVVGGGFIGMEVASVLAQKNVRTTLVIREERVWSRVFTPEMSRFFENYYSRRGVTVRKQASLSAIEGKGSVHALRLSDGEEIACDLVVAGIGVTPVTDF